MVQFKSSPLVRKLGSVFALSAEEKEALESLPVNVVSFRADQDIVREGDRPSRSFAVLEGFCATYSMTSDGKRQIMAFHIPGDMPDLQSLHLDILDNSVGTITPCTVGFIQHEALWALCLERPRLAAALWRETLIDAAIFRRWLTNVGQRDAFARIAHILCEMVIRMRAVGLAEDHSCDFPITQSEIGDALGLSVVHVNRTLQEIREAGLIVLKGGRLQVLDWDGLKLAGDFDPTYLHLKDRQAAA
jgi:CRP-like cAMP-binding protein